MKKLIFSVFFLVCSTVSGWAEGERMIVTTGTATVEAEPDMATLRVGVAREARLAGDALQLTSDAMTTVLARLKDAGIEDRDMQTQGLSLQPVWSQQSSTSSDPRRITGFVARNGLVIRVRSLENLGGLLDLVVQDGANTFDGLSFSVQEQEALLAKARADAVRDAIEKAEQLAIAAGVTLGPVLNISEGGNIPRPAMMEMAAARMADAVPIAAGEVSLSVQVNMSFGISDE